VPRPAYDLSGDRNQRLIGRPYPIAGTSRGKVPHMGDRQPLQRGLGRPVAGGAVSPHERLLTQLVRRRSPARRIIEPSLARIEGGEIHAKGEAEMIFAGKALRRQRGQGLVEYALILVLVAIVVIAALMILGPVIGNTFSTINASITSV
jgi:pilus assembly protein Flp/PilA